MSKEATTLTIPLGHDAAIRSSVVFLRERFIEKACDSEGVSDCVRCNVLYLASIFGDNK